MSISNLNPDLNKIVISQNEKHISSNQSIYGPTAQEVTSCSIDKISNSLSSPPKASFQIHHDAIPEFPPSPPTQKTAKKTSTISKASIKAIRKRATEMRTKQPLTPPLKETDNDPFIVSDAPDSSFLSLPLGDKDTSLFVLGKGKRKFDFSAPGPSRSLNSSSVEKFSDDELPFFLNSAEETQPASLIPSPLKKEGTPSPTAKTFIRDRAKKLRTMAFSPVKPQNLSTALSMRGTEDAFSSPPKRKNLNALFTSSLFSGKSLTPPSSLSSEASLDMRGTEDAFSSPPKRKNLNALFTSPLSSGKSLTPLSSLSSEAYDSPQQIQKDAEKTKIIFSPKFSPTSTGILSVLAATPESSRSRKKQKENRPLFSNPLETSTDSMLRGAKKTTLFDPELVYRLNGKTHNLVKQAGNKSCGAATLLMLYTDIVRRKGISFDLNAEFWRWYSHSTLTVARNVCDAAERYTNLSANKLKIESLLLPCHQEQSPIESAEMHICEIEKHLKTSGLPCILSITHPNIDGHWIVIDAINGQEIALRDPFAGRAYQISRSDLINYFSDDPQYLLYCTDTSTEEELL